MGLFSTDLRGAKQQCCDLIDEMNEQCGVIADSKRMRQLEAVTEPFPVDRLKLMILLKSQIMSGNKPGAKEVIMAYVPDVKYAWWVQVGLWPLVATARLIGVVIDFLRPIGRFGKL